jgi:SAM-dependent methyltransferase
MPRLFDPAEPELMDRPQPVTSELERDLANLRKLNRWFGSYRLVRHFLSRWIRPNESLRVLDIATGSGDIPRLVVDYARERGARLQVTAIDQQRSTLEIARRLSAGYDDSIEFVPADALTFQPAIPYDFVLCSLALHHFRESDAVRLLARCREISHRYVLVADLRRGWLATAGVYLLTQFIYREAMTRVDARLSAQRAFSFPELHTLAVRAGWLQFGHARFRFARQAIWLEASR